jgi:hypothetical protein
MFYKKKQNCFETLVQVFLVIFAKRPWNYLEVFLYYVSGRNV